MAKKPPVPTKSKIVTLGASAPKKPPNALNSLAKKDYKKTNTEAVNVSFGQTGLTGQS